MISVLGEVGSGMLYYIHNYAIYYCIFQCLQLSQMHHIPMQGWIFIFPASSIIDDHHPTDYILHEMGEHYNCFSLHCAFWLIVCVWH